MLQSSKATVASSTVKNRENVTKVPAHICATESQQSMYLNGESFARYIHAKQFLRPRPTLSLTKGQKWEEEGMLWLLLYIDNPGATRQSIWHSAIWQG